MEIAMIPAAPGRIIPTLERWEEEARLFQHMGFGLDLPQKSGVPRGAGFSAQNGSKRFLWSMNEVDEELDFTDRLLDWKCWYHF